MAEAIGRFDDGAAYERMMGTWSRLVGEQFLGWLAPARGLRWVDIGCGNGAFTELLVQRCAPAAVDGVDPSEAQLVFARTRAGTRMAAFRRGDAMALPFADASFDAAVMALVIFFVSDPGKGVAEMKRVLRPGGMVTAYAWDLEGGGSPLLPIDRVMNALNLRTHRTVSAGAAGIDALRDLWSAAGLEAVAARRIDVERSFASFDEFWDITVAGSLLKTTIAGLPSAEVAALKEQVRAGLPADGQGRVSYGAYANAVTGRVPG